MSADESKPAGPSTSASLGYLTLDGWDEVKRVSDVARDAIKRGCRVRVLASHKQVATAIYLASSREVDVQFLGDPMPREEVDIVILAGDVVSDSVAREISFLALYQGIVLDMRSKRPNRRAWIVEAARRSVGISDV